MEGVLRHKVRLLPHNEEWEKEYVIVKEEILAAWGDVVMDIQHIGSTSIRGIYAKPILDVAVVVKSFREMKPEALVELGYEYKGPDLPDEDRHLFILRDEKDYSLRHIHCYEQGNADFLDCVGFRGYMNSHPEEAKAYSDLKLELEKQYAEDRATYGLGKHEFIQSIYAKVREQQYLFQTEHLRIRKFCPQDAHRLYENHLETEVKQWIPNESYADFEEARGAIAFYADCVSKGHLPYVLAVEDKEMGEFIGDTGVNEVEGKPGEVEIGYCICKKYSGRGYATELLEAMTRFVAKTFDIRTLYGRVMRGNNASVRVLEKNGYVFLTEEFCAEDDPYGNGMLIYGKTIMLE